MPHSPAALKLFDASNNPLLDFPESLQKEYLLEYLEGLGLRAILEEPQYFDRDWLSEYSAFYAVTSAGHGNLCRRLHFFSCELTNDQLFEFAGGNKLVSCALQDHYLGFLVLRPIPSAPFGRTVLRWYHDADADLPRVTNTAREYTAHLLGQTLSITTLAWQQQDSAVSACATVALWSILHSSAFDAFHAIPTTAEITHRANDRLFAGNRTFPSQGLNVEQLCGAIMAFNKSPEVVYGDEHAHGVCFSPERFSNTVAAFARSGYPVLMGGDWQSGNDRSAHAAVITGFRSAHPDIKNLPDVTLQDSSVGIFYVHDDNIGANVRFRREEVVHADGRRSVVLRCERPPYQNTERPEIDYGFVPRVLIIAVDNDLRTSAESLLRRGLEEVSLLGQVIKSAPGLKEQENVPGLSMSARFIRISDYVGAELAGVLAERPRDLAQARLDFANNVPPMPLHLGVVRVGFGALSTPALDILFDTTDTERSQRVFARLLYIPEIKPYVDALASAQRISNAPIICLNRV